NKKVKVIRCDNGTDFKNRDLDKFYGMKKTKREYRNARTPQQNGVAERNNRNLIEAARTMLADSLLPITFWAEVVNTAWNQTNKNVGPQDTTGNACTQDNVDAEKEVSDQHYIVLPLWSSISSTFKRSDDKAKDAKTKDDTSLKTVKERVNKEDQAYRDELDRLMTGSTNLVNTVSNPINAARTSGTFSAGGPTSPHPDAFIPSNTLLHVDQDDSQIPALVDTAELQNTGIFNIAYDDDLEIFTSLLQSVDADADFNNIESSTIMEPKKAIRTKWVYVNKKDERGIVVTNKARLVAQGHIQEEGIEYNEVFAPVARIKAIRIFLAIASFIGFIVYQMDVKSSFLYGTIEEVVYVCQPSGFIDPHSSSLMSSMGELTFFLGLQVKQSKEGIFISQDKYVARILKKFDFSFVKSASTPIKTQKTLVKDEEATNVDVYLYRSIIGSLMYLIASRPDIMFAVCACSRFQVTPKLHIFML
nr:hypothetical protein [Tanacetum cinerariifolium]